ncbi:hypothetical protein HPC49_52815 [Pyxidicoccus fallax]|uniref:Uncharacterized protein n=1 Tax=Pyxidicoccus fallax TaxID=394095 RepID=A0A848LZW8_9BACT|nr:hypothetical protein [Pyxidicoccus fallax]NMO23179.1 hypothetical protein [Pyxidicoccus fallax]NPC86855.1 hypothetical protein [Pyxidicoccus fallax]
MKQLRSLALFCVLIPGVGLSREVASSTAPRPEATSEAPAGTPSVPAADAPLRQDRSPEESPPPSVSSIAEDGSGEGTRRVLTELLVGGGGVVLGTLAGEALSGGSFTNCGRCEDDNHPMVRLGAGLGAGLGVYAAGSFMGGKGSFWATMTGAGLGAGTGYLLFRNSEYPIPLSSLVVLLPLGGAIVGYEISSARGDDSPPSQRAEAPRLIPVAGSTRDGGLLGGLVGRF